MVGRRTVLLGIAVLLCAAALSAIGILLFGHFGRTEVRIVGTTAALGAVSLLALPAVVLREQRRAAAVALANLTAAAVAAAAAVLAIWWPGSIQGRIAVTAVVTAAATTQAAALLARRRPEDPPVVVRIYTASLGTAAVVAGLVIVLTWYSHGSPGYGRVLASFVVLDVLFVALQPLLARLRPPSHHYVLQLELDTGGEPVVEVDAGDIASAAARAIGAQERSGNHVTALRVVTQR